MVPPRARRPRDPREEPPQEPLLDEAEWEARMGELRSALDGLRAEIRARFPSRRPAGHGGAAPGFEALFAALRRRLATLGMSERSGEVDEFGLDQVVLEQARPLLDFLFERYWRVELHGISRLPESGPALLVANSSGLVPWDGLMLCHALFRERPTRPLARFFVADWLWTLPFVQPSLARVGGVRACRENAERLLSAGRLVVAFPEGVKGAAKAFRDRYRLQRFGRGGAVRLALETGVPLVPVGLVGGEEAHPILFKWRAPARALGLPFLPVTPTFPWLGPLGLLPLPSKWVIRIGEPLRFDHFGRDAASDELLLSRLTEELRGEVQTLLEIGLRDRQTVWG
jgi:1-acyl-sn-glycerol-3-phosphate acyltransferase